MHHLTAEDFARLVEERPSTDERAHLEACRRCATELDRMSEQVLLLAELPDPEVPESLHWRIKEALTDERFTPARRSLDGPWLRTAAGIALFVLGGAVGASSRPPVGAPPVAPVAASPDAGNVDAAAVALANAEAQYLQALAVFAQYNYAGEALDPLSRLAALEGIVLTTRAALREAPADPVINNYHLTALGQREALLRQMEEVSETSDEWF